MYRTVVFLRFVVVLIDVLLVVEASCDSASGSTPKSSILIGLTVVVTLAVLVVILVVAAFVVGLIVVETARMTLCLLNTGWLWA